MPDGTVVSLNEFAKIIDKVEFQKPYLFMINLLDMPMDADNPSDVGVPVEQYGGKIVVLNPMQYCISNTAFPTSSTDIQTIPYFNSEMKFAKKTSYNNWQVTFRYDIKSDENFTVAKMEEMDLTCYQYFDYWRNSVYWEERRTSSLPKKYKKDIRLYLVDELGQTHSYFVLENAWPSALSGGDLNYSNDGFLTFNVDFAFDRYIFYRV